MCIHFCSMGYKLYSGSVRKKVVITSIQIKVKLKYNELGSEENRSQCKVSLFPQMF